MTRRGYARVSAIVFVVLVGMSVWVAAGYGFPGGSAYRRMTGQEGITGGLTTAMRLILRGDFAGGAGRHPSAAWVAAYLVAQLAWRVAVMVRRPPPERLWIADLCGSLGLFAAAIYVPYLLR